MATMTQRYAIVPVDDEQCESASGEAIAETQDEQEAQDWAVGLSAEYPYGVAILDTWYGRIDIGHGWQ